MMRSVLRIHHSSLIIHHFLILIALLSFILLAAHQLTLPGLHYDEAKEAGLNAMQLMTGQPVTAFREATVGVGPWRLPLMVQDYIGSLNVLLALPFLAIGGLNVSALRWLPVCIGALTLVVTGRVAQRLGGPVAALVAVCLLAVNPTFIFWSRQGIFVTNLTALFFMFSLWTGLRWWQERRPTDLWWTAFLWGLGLYAKLLFAWAVGAMSAVAIVAWGVKRWQIANSKSANGKSVNQHSGCVQSAICNPQFAICNLQFAIRISVIAVVCFLLPLLPLILFNLQTGGTLISIFGNLGQSYYGVNNLAYLPNLLTRLDQLRTLLRGDHLWYLGVVYANLWAPWLAAGAAALGGLLWASPRLKAAFTPSPRHPLTPSPCHPVTPSPRHRPLLLPFGLLALIVAQSAFTVSDLFITHYALLVPLIPLGVGLVTARLFAAARERSSHTRSPHVSRLAYSAFCILHSALLFTWGATDLANTLRYHRVLSVAGGYATHSDAIYRLADFLRARAPSAPLALDWGVDAPVRYLTAGQVNPVEVFGYERLDGPDPGFAGRVAPFLDNPDNLYVAHTGEFTIFRGRAAALAQLAAAHGFRLEEAARFGERSGRPLFLVYRAVKP
jgi:4-amino-4-deoxy-L-arabinose transferase-like glycosyltransferase